VVALGALGGAALAAFASGGGEAAAEGGGDKVPELPNIFELLHEAFPHAAWAKWLFHWQNPIFSTLVIVLLCVIAAKAYRKRTMIPGPLQNGVEAVVEAFSNFILGILGPRGREFVPFLGTLFLYIWWNNLIGLVPFGKSPTSAFTTTVSLAICVFCYVQYTGVTKLGIIGYLHHLIGSPQDVIGWCMVPLMLPLHLIEEVAKPLSLSLRLFGNIMGEDVLLGVFAMLGVSMLAFLKLPIGVPLHLPFIFLAVLLSTIQALVFTLLSTIYFLQMLPHDEHEGEMHGQPL
jgi:F-type H+-transporting ATPase subunit a